MATVEFPSNNGGQEKRVAPVVPAGKVTQKEESKIKKAIVGGDATKVKDYIIFDAIIPTIKNVIEDVVCNTVSILLRGETRGSRASRGGYSGGVPATRASYGNYYQEQSVRSREVAPRDRMSSTTLIFEDYVDPKTNDCITGVDQANAVLNGLEDVIGRYHAASILDMNDLAGVTSTPSDSNYGWRDVRDIRMATVENLHNGRAELRMPRVQPLR